MNWAVGGRAELSLDQRASTGQPERVAHRVASCGFLAAGFAEEIYRLEYSGPEGYERDGRDRVIALLVSGVGASGARAVRLVAGRHGEEVAGPADLQPSG